MSDLSPELLAQHDGWLRALVRRLVDDGQADDVVQEVWGHAMHAELRDRKALPAWLARVARRVAGKNTRSNKRRRHHEQIASDAQPAATVDPSELVARVEGRQKVAETVLQLDEPFRTVVLLRYFEDQTPDQIAKQLDIPSATVRTRLHRAHEQLRQRFERERGKEWRGQLAVLVAPMGMLDGAEPAPATTAQPKALFVLVPAAIVALVWIVVQTMTTTPPPASSTTNAVAPATADDTARADLTEDVGAEREVVPTDEDETPPTPRSQTVRIAGQVVDYRGQPVGDLPIAFVKGWPKYGGPDEADLQLLGTCDRGGRFEVEVPREQGSLRIHSHAATLRSWLVGHNGDDEGTDDALIVAARLVQLDGIVVNEDGTPAPGREVRVHIEDTVGLPIPASGTFFEMRKIHTTTDAAGNFSLRDVPGFPFGDLGVGKILVNDAIMPIPTYSRHDLRLVLGTGARKVSPRPKAAAKHPASQWFAIQGTVYSLSGAPIEGACIAAVDTGAEDWTEEDGTFRVQGRAHKDRPTTLKIAAPGHAPMQREVWPEQGTKTVQVTVRLNALDDTSPAIYGRVVNENNVPVQGMTVTLADATLVDQGSIAPRFIEAPERHEHGPHDVTDSHGRFRIPGVLPRNYDLRIFDEETGFAQTHGPFHPNQEWTVHIEQPRVRPEFNLRAFSLSGNEVRGAKVELSVVLIHNQTQGVGGTSTFTSFVGESKTTTTDGSGACRFINAPGGDLRITVTKPGFVPTEVLHSDKGNVLEVRMARLLPFRVAAKGLDDRYTMLEVFDEFGNRLEVKPAWRGKHYPNMHKFGLWRGHSVVAAIPETASYAEIRDLHSKELIRKMPVVFREGEVTVLDFPQ